MRPSFVTDSIHAATDALAYPPVASARPQVLIAFDDFFRQLDHLPRGNAGINAQLYVYVARWFDRRRGTALALIASGQAAAGTILAPLFGRTIEWFGWRHTMQIYAVFAFVVIIPVAFLVFRSLPREGLNKGMAQG